MLDMIMQISNFLVWNTKLQTTGIHLQPVTHVAVEYVTHVHLQHVTHVAVEYVTHVHLQHVIHVAVEYVTHVHLQPVAVERVLLRLVTI